jgi:hypothetical protein
MATISIAAGWWWNSGSSIQAGAVTLESRWATARNASTTLSTLYLVGAHGVSSYVVSPLTFTGFQYRAGSAQA